MGSRELKTLVVTLLADGEMERFLSLIKNQPAHALLPPLFSALCHPSATVRHNAVSGFGMLVPLMAHNDPEAARIVMRRFLWSLNEESGGIGWGAPEAMARILGASSLLRREYLHLLCSYMRGDGPELFQDGNYLELPMLQRGLLVGIGDLCRDFPNEMRAQGVAEDILLYLDSPDHQVVGLAFRCLGFLAVLEARERMVASLNHRGLVEFFDAGEERLVTVGELAAEALARCDAACEGQSSSVSRGKAP